MDLLRLLLCFRIFRKMKLIEGDHLIDMIERFTQHFSAVLEFGIQFWEKKFEAQFLLTRSLPFFLVLDYSDEEEFEIEKTWSKKKVKWTVRKSDKATK